MEENLSRNLPKHSKLIRELEQIESVERSDMRMLETTRHRLRTKLKKFEVPRLSSGSDAIDVRMYDTHNPGFCYRSNGAIRACDTSRRKRTMDIFDLVHSMIFTNGEVDPDKVLCLHLLTAYCAKSAKSTAKHPGIVSVISSMETGTKEESFSGAWNTTLPCYVVDIEQNLEDSDEVKRHEDPLVMEAEDELVREYRCNYEKYVKENSDVGLALATDNKRTKMMPNGIGKKTIIPPHVYSLLGAAEELKIKQAIAEESRRKKFRRSSSSFRNIDDQSISFQLEDDEDAISRRLVTISSVKGWTGQRFVGVSKVSRSPSLSRRSATSSRKTQPSITTLKRVSPIPSKVPRLAEDLDEVSSQIVSLKRSNQALISTASKTSNVKSPFRNFSSAEGPGSPCGNSIMSGMSWPLGEPRRIRRPIFVNAPAESLELRARDYKTVQIMVNNQMQALVQSTMDVLEHVNPEKMRKIVSTASDPLEIRRMLSRPDIQSFVDTLLGQPLVSSPDSFVVSIASIVNEIDPRLESDIEKELVATTLDIPPAPGLYRIVGEIRHNLFPESVETKRCRVEPKVETFGSQKKRLSDFRGDSETASPGVFDVDSSCTHADVLENKATCACCYAKWKDSLPEVERSEVPDFSFLLGNKNELSPDNVAKYLPNDCKINPAQDEEKQATLEAQASGKQENTSDGSVPLDNYLNPETTAQAVIVQSEEITSSNPANLEPEVTVTESPNRNTDLSSVKKTHSPRSRPRKSEGLPEARRSMESKASRRTLSAKISRQSGKKLSVKSLKARIKLFRLRDSSLTAEPSSKTSLQKQDFKNTLGDEEPSPMCQFQPWKCSRDPAYLDPDRVILRRMTNPQRILVGQMCASLKTRKINMEGLVKERTPLAVLIAPVLSHESLRILTKGTRQSNSRKQEKVEEKDECVTTMSEKLTGPVLAQVRQAVAENETELRLMSFLKSRS